MHPVALHLQKSPESWVASLQNKRHLWDFYFSGCLLSRIPRVHTPSNAGFYSCIPQPCPCTRPRSLRPLYVQDNTTYIRLLNLRFLVDKLLWVPTPFYLESYSFISWTCIGTIYDLYYRHSQCLGSLIFSSTFIRSKCVTRFVCSMQSCLYHLFPFGILDEFTRIFTSLFPMVLLLYRWI